MSVTVFLPCRKGSVRVPHKNTKVFAGIEGGLLKIKLDQLVRISSIDAIILSSNDEVVLDYVANYKSSKVIVDERPDYLGTSETSTDELINYVPSIISGGHVLWTHVTSPFLDGDGYQKILNKYFDALAEGYDSLMTVKELRGFVWDEDGPISYKRQVEKWPRTQTIKPLYEVDSSVFLNTIDQYKKHNDRIGERPWLYVQDKEAALDIDWPEDFLIAEKIWLAKQECAER